MNEPRDQQNPFLIANKGNGLLQKTFQISV